MQRSVFVAMLFAALAAAPAARAGQVCTYNVRFAVGTFCPVHSGAQLCLQQTAVIGPCDENVRCYGGHGFSCQAELEPRRGPEEKCPLGSVRPRGLICYRPIQAGRPRTPTATEVPMLTPTATAIPEVPTFTPTVTAAPTGTAMATSTLAATATQTVAGTSTLASTATATLAPPATATGTAAATATQTAVATGTATSLPIGTATNTAGATSTATTAPTATATGTAGATSTATTAPTATGTNTAGATSTATATLTNTAGPTSTATTAPTNTPVPTNTAGAIGKAVCTLTTGSELFLQTQALPLTLTPTGSFSIDCGAPGAGGTAACACELIQFDAVVIPAIGDVCVNPAAGCAPGLVDCDGGSPIDVNLNADHDIGDCTSNAACATACDAHCASLGTGFARQSFGCEGHCQGGTNDAAVCTRDSECPGGQCPGGEPVGHANTCNCVCAGDNLGDAARAGGLYCNLGTQINVELPSSGACGDQPVTIQLPPVCGGVTTETSTGVVNDANNSTGVTIPATGPESVDGVNLTCDALKAKTITGLTLKGQLGFFDSTLGDIRSRNTFVCQ